MQPETILDNLQTLQTDIARYAMDPAQPPLLLPVTKTQPIEAILPLAEAGVTQIGENRVQEIVEKYPQLSGAFGIHLIGRLQTNKIKYIIDRVCMVQSLDRPALAQALDGRAQDAGVRMPVLIEVNIGGEAQKAGIPPEEIEAFARVCARLPGLSVCGLMTVMPMVPDAEVLRPLFRQMRSAFERLRDLAIDGTEIRALSMGMSDDWRVAAQEGATILRVGSAIFGRRSPPGGGSPL